MEEIHKTCIILTLIHVLELNNNGLKRNNKLWLLIQYLGKLMILYHTHVREILTNNCRTCKMALLSSRLKSNTA